LAATRSGLCQWCILFRAHTIGEFSQIFKFNSAFEDFRRRQICLICRRWSRRGVPDTFFWVERLEPYVDRWATVFQNLVEKVRPHDDTAWEAYIQWYTPRTRARVMYVPPPQPAASDPDATRVLASTVYPVRRDQHYDTTVSYKIHRLSLMVLYILQFTNNFFAVRHDCGPFTYCRGLDGEAGPDVPPKISDAFLRMGAITSRFLAAVNYHDNPTLPLFPRYPQSSSSTASTVRSHTASSSSSRPPF
jgi:hypothetical protein